VWNDYVVNRNLEWEVTLRFLWLEDVDYMSEDMQLKLVKVYPDCIKYIWNPCNKIKLLIKLQENV